jgi:sugar phosphate isomerase/epimerase
MRATVQLYTLRDALEADWKGTLAAVREIGLEYVELAGFYGQTAADWKSALDELGLKASGAHIGVEALENDFDATVADAKTLGMKFIIIPWVDASKVGGWAAFGEKLNVIGAKLAAEGLSLAYHNHDFEYANGDGLAELYGAAAPENLVAEIDAAWVKIGGHDPIAVIGSLAGRVPLVHGKDFDLSKTPRWTPAGEGTMDLPGVFAAAEAAGTEFIAIELDESPGAPIDAVRASYAYFKTLGVS